MYNCFLIYNRLLLIRYRSPRPSFALGSDVERKPIEKHYETSTKIDLSQVARVMFVDYSDRLRRKRIRPIGRDKSEWNFVPTSAVELFETYFVNVFILGGGERQKKVSE